MPLKVLSKAKSFPLLQSRSSSRRNKRPAANAANSGRSGDSPLAIRSEFTKWITPASFARNSRAKVVFPAPLGPAMMMHLGGGRTVLAIVRFQFRRTADARRDEETGEGSRHE